MKNSKKNKKSQTIRLIKEDLDLEMDFLGDSITVSKEVSNDVDPDWTRLQINLRKQYGDHPGFSARLSWDGKNVHLKKRPTVLVERRKLGVATQKVEVATQKVGLATLSLPPPPTHFALWRIKNSVSRMTKHDSIQNHCRDVILRHLHHEDQIEELKLPPKLKRFITEALSDVSQ